jgi:hypothetical protein
VYASPPPTAAKMTLVAMVTNTPGVGDLLHTDEVRVRPDLGGAEVIIVEGLPNNFTYDDFTVASDVEYEYRVETRSVIDTTVGGVWTQ